jgi:hypothetical protein
MIKNKKKIEQVVDVVFVVVVVVEVVCGSVHGSGGIVCNSSGNGCSVCSSSGSVVVVVVLFVIVVVVFVVVVRNLLDTGKFKPLSPFFSFETHFFEYGQCLIMSAYSKKV